MAIHRCILGLLAACALAAGAAAPRAHAEEAAAAPAGAEQTPSFTINVGDAGGRFAVTATNADVSKIAAELARKAGWQIRLVPEVQRPVTVNIAEESFENVLTQLGRTVGYVWTRVYAVTPKKEGDALPDPFKLPLGLPNVSLQAAGGTPAVVFTALREQARIEVEASDQLQGQVNIQVQDAPVSEVLDNICKQINAVWTLSYRLTPSPTATRPGAGTGAPGGAGGGAADGDAAAAADMQQWMNMSPADRQRKARKDISDILRAGPAERKERASELGGQLTRLSRALAKMPPDQRAKLAPVVNDRVGPYLQELNRITPEQQRELQGVVQGAQRLIRLITPPQPGQPRPR